MLPINSRLIIPSVHKLSHLDEALKCKSPVVLLTGVHLGNICALTEKCHESGKKVLVRPDLIRALRSDEWGVKLLAKEFKVDGVFTGSNSTAKLAKEMGLGVYWRIFLLDSRARDEAIQLIEKTPWDGFEIVPSPTVLTEGLDVVKACLGRPVIAGGFVSSQTYADALFDAGVSAINTSRRSLWPK